MHFLLKQEAEVQHQWLFFFNCQRPLFYTQTSKTTFNNTCNGQKTALPSPASHKTADLQESEDDEDERETVFVSTVRTIEVEPRWLPVIKRRAIF